MVKFEEPLLDKTSDTDIKIKKKKAGRRLTLYLAPNQVAPEVPEEPEPARRKASKIDDLNLFGQLPKSGKSRLREVKFDTYSPPIASYDFYKSYDEYLALLVEYKADGSTDKHDALKHVWQHKMELELLSRFPWPPKLARNTFWTFGYYRDYYPTEEQIKPKITQNFKSLFLGNAAEYNAISKAQPADYNSLQTDKKQTPDYMDSTAISTAAVSSLEDFSIMDGFENANKGLGRKKSRKSLKDDENDDSISTFNTKPRKSKKYSWIGSDSSMYMPSESSMTLQGRDKKNKKSKQYRGRRSIAYSWVPDPSEDQEIDILPVEDKSKKKKNKKRRQSKTIYETTVYDEKGSVISTEITEELNK